MEYFQLLPTGPASCSHDARPSEVQCPCGCRLSKRTSWGHCIVTFLITVRHRQLTPEEIVMLWHLLDKRRDLSWVWDLARGLALIGSDNKLDIGETPAVLAAVKRAARMVIYHPTRYVAPVKRKTPPKRSAVTAKVDPAAR